MATTPTCKILLVSIGPSQAEPVRRVVSKITSLKVELREAYALDSAIQEIVAGTPDVVLFEFTSDQDFVTFERLSARFPLIPVIVFTSFEDEELGFRAVKSGAQDHLFKQQIDRNLLVRSIRYAIERHRSGVEMIRLAKAVQTMQIGVTITDAEGRIVYTNPAEAEMHGYTPEELQGKNVQVFSDNRNTTPLTKEKMKQMRSWKRESWNVRRDGTRFPVQLLSDVVLNSKGEPVGVITTCENITERRESQQALKESEERFRVMAEATGDVLYRIGYGTKVFDYVSPPIEKLTGYTPKEISEIGLEKLIKTFGTQGSTSIIPLFTTPDQESRADYLIVTKQGETKWISNHCYPWIDPNGRLIGCVGVLSDVTERKLAEERVQYQAYHDHLTDLPNRLLFKDRLAVALPHAQRNKRMLAVLLIDVDRFKLINETLGHPAGDQLLIQIAGRLDRMIREGDTLARMSGDVFGVLLPEAKSMQTTAKVAETIVTAFTEPFLVGSPSTEVHITISIGISNYPDTGSDEQTLLRNADIALTRAKKDGGNSYRHYSGEMNASILQRLSLENSLHKALARDEFVVHYQPQLDLKSGKITAVEALVRWKHPDFGLLAPEQFIPLAEEIGLIIPIGEEVLRLSCIEAKKWSRRKNLRMAVNVSPSQIAQEDFVDMVLDILKSSGISPENLELEITESTFFRNSEVAASVLKKLNRHGIQIALDDFGTGYSSLGYLKQLKIQTLKLDRTFIRDVNTNTNNAAIVSAVIALAQALDMRVVAEGVEHIEQLRFLHKLNCDAIQGFLLSAPLPSHDCSEFLTRSKAPSQLVQMSPSA